MSSNYAKYSGLGGGGGSVTTGDLTDVGTDGIVITGGTNAVVGSGTQLAQHVADSTHNGYLSSTDWNTFNSKQATLTIGTLDSQTASANGAVIATNSLVMQSASATRPGLVNNTTQIFTGVKTFDTVNVVSGGVYQYGGATAISFPATGCSFLGITAGAGNSANYNTGLGIGTLSDSPSGGLNTAVGAFALQHVTSGVNNTALGVNAGTNITTEIGSICIGYASNVAGGANNALALGTNSLVNASNSVMFGDSNVNVGIANVNSSVPTARLHIPAGTTAAGKAPLKIESGTNLTSPEAGAVEWDGTNLYVTQTSGPTRKTIAYTSDLSSYLPLAGGTMSGVINMGSHKITSVTDPTAAQDAATKAYVDNVAAGINPAVAVQAATTSAGNTSGLTYSNGASGIGATFTGAVNTALTVDGYTFTTLGQRLLVKNDTQSPSGAFNGVYYVTQVQTAILPLILTRALDYDMPSDINNTGAIPVINGTVNGTTQWVITSLVTTVGTDPLTFAQFARNPADYLLKANNLSDVAVKATSFDNLSPMTTGGDLIYGGASGTGTRLANGSANQVLQSNGTTLAPTWTTNIAGNAGNVTGTVAIANGGTGQTSKAAGFDALSPMTTSGDVIYGGASGTGTRLAKGSDGQVLTLASGIPSWAGGAANLAVTSAQTGTYAIQTSDNVVIVNPSSSFTATLPTAVGVTGKQYFIKNIKNDLTKVVTLATTSAQTIDGYASVTLNTLNEDWSLVSDGANWQVLSHKTFTPWVSYTPTYTGFGTVTNNFAKWRRSGNSLEVQATLTAGTTSTLASATLPSGLSMDAAQLSLGNTTANTGSVVGWQCGNGTNNSGGVLTATGTSTSVVYFGTVSVSTATTPQNGNNILNNNEDGSFSFKVPISGWYE